ncbi:MAG TPA: CPBP family glutamic-type intramembrane protease [Nocardioides sp.]|jgi:hypothetical protein
MTTTSLLRPRSVTTSPPDVVSLVLLGTGAALVLAGQSVWAVVPAGGVLLWGIREAGNRSAARQVRGHATTLVAVVLVLAVSMPAFLPPAVDQLMLAVLVAGALVALIIASPAVRAAVRPRRLALGDLGWWAVALFAALAVSMSVGPVAVPGSGLERAAIADLVLLVPLVSEVLFRGLLMHGRATLLRGVAPAALAQASVCAALFGWNGLVVGGLLGVVLGVIRLRGGWQASLYAHWGLALGLAVPVLTGVG